MNSSMPGRRAALGWMLGLAAALLAGAGRGDAAAPRVIRIHARKFVFTPDHIPLRAGESVVFELTAQDVIMGFSVPDFGVRADVAPGVTVRLPATARGRGNYGFLCDIFCGSGHETMNGIIEVT
ncbi:cupredoxin domain-containing protein [Cupriavidus necator]|uniref:cupredoxin domain-containing protein n=1 Tax=Cupriavidus necator TaxID=106590 RepID=UPI0005B34D9F